MERAFERVLKEIAREYGKRLLAHRPFPKKATGRLAGSIGTGVDTTDKEMTGYLMLEDYWKYVEYGRRKGARQPPVSAIRKWIEDRRIKPWNGQTRDSLAFAIAKSIKKNGIPPTGYLSQAVRDVADRNRERLERAGYEVLYEALEDYFNNKRIL